MATLQKALALALSGMTAPSETTNATPVGVAFFDHTPENAAYPLIVLQRHDTDNENDSYDADETRHEITLEVPTRYRGTRQALAVLAEIKARLHGKPLQLENGTCEVLRVGSQSVERDQDGKAYTGTVVLHATTS